MKPAAAFLDRDGVINRGIMRNAVSCPPMSVDEVEILPDVPDAIARLRRAGFAIVVVTNQPDVARQRQSREVVEAINTVIGAQLPIDEFRVCYHDDADRCSCRKPEPGLLTQAPEHDLPHSVMIGDRWRDIEAGRRAGVGATVLITIPGAEPCSVEADARAGSLGEAADWVLNVFAARYQPGAHGHPR